MTDRITRRPSIQEISLRRIVRPVLSTAAGSVGLFAVACGGANPNINADNVTIKGPASPNAASGGEPTQRPNTVAEPTQAPTRTITEPQATCQTPDIKTSQLGKEPHGEWFRPEGFNCGIQLSNLSEGAHLASTGRTGEVIVANDSGISSSNVYLGIKTEGEFINNHKWGGRPGSKKTQNPDWKAGAWITIQPNTLIVFSDPKTGEHYKDSTGHVIAVLTDSNGDAGVLLPNNGEVLMKWPNGPKSSLVRFGPHDNPRATLPIADLSQVARQ